MKFRVYLSANTQPIPINYMHQLCGVFHYWLGHNDLHNMLSLYSLGWLKGNVQVIQSESLFFKEGASWDIGIHNDEIAERLIRGLLLKPPVFHGMCVQRVERLKEPEFMSSKTIFSAGSPILLRKTNHDQSRTFILYDHPDHSIYLKRVLDHKLHEAGLNGLQNNYAIYFDQGYTKAKTKLIKIKSVFNKASVCPIVIVGPPEVKRFLWTVGAGEGTGVGFGSMDWGKAMRHLHERGPRKGEVLRPFDAA